MSLVDKRLKKWLNTDRYIADLEFFKLCILKNGFVPVSLYSRLYNNVELSGWLSPELIHALTEKLQGERLVDGYYTESQNAKHTAIKETNRILETLGDVRDLQYREDFVFCDEFCDNYETCINSIFTDCEQSGTIRADDFRGLPICVRNMIIKYALECIKHEDYDKNNYFSVDWLGEFLRVHPGLKKHVKEARDIYINAMGYDKIFCQFKTFDEIKKKIEESLRSGSYKKIQYGNIAVKNTEEQVVVVVKKPFYRKISLE